MYNEPNSKRTVRFNKVRHRRRNVQLFTPHRLQDIVQCKGVATLSKLDGDDVFRSIKIGSFPVERGTCQPLPAMSETEESVSLTQLNGLFGNQVLSRGVCRRCRFVTVREPSSNRSSSVIIRLVITVPITVRPFFFFFFLF